MNSQVSNYVNERRQSTNEPHQRLIVFILMFVGGAFMVREYRDKIIRPGVKMDVHMWHNTFAVGYAWGLAGVLAPLGVFIFFYTGMSKVVRHVDHWYIGWLLEAILLAPAGLGVFTYLHQIHGVWGDDIQRDGFIWGTGTALYISAVIPALWLVLFNTTVPRIRNRVLNAHMFQRRMLITNSNMPHYEHDDHDGRPELYDEDLAASHSGGEGD